MRADWIGPPFRAFFTKENDVDGTAESTAGATIFFISSSRLLLRLTNRKRLFAAQTLVIFEHWKSYRSRARDAVYGGPLCNAVKLPSSHIAFGDFSQLSNTELTLPAWSLYTSRIYRMELLVLSRRRHVMMIALYLVPRMVQHQTLGSVCVIGNGMGATYDWSYVRTHVRDARDVNFDSFMSSLPSSDVQRSYVHRASASRLARKYECSVRYGSSSVYTDQPRKSHTVVTTITAALHEESSRRREPSSIVVHLRFVSTGKRSCNVNF